MSEPHKMVSVDTMDAWRQRALTAESRIAELESSRDYARSELARYIDGAAGRQEVSERALSLVSMRAKNAENRIAELEATIAALPGRLRDKAADGLLEGRGDRWAEGVRDCADELEAALAPPGKTTGE